METLSNPLSIDIHMAYSIQYGYRYLYLEKIIAFNLKKNKNQFNLKYKTFDLFTNN